MTASEKSYIGFAKQTAKGTPNVTDAEYTYFLFTEGGIGPDNQFLPLDQEVGGGAMARSVVKTGVVSSGVFTAIPRPTMIGNILTGLIGKDTITGTGPSYTHTIEHDTSEFDAPWYSFRSAPGDIWGETFQDIRMQALTLNWKAADYVRAQLAVIGGLPVPNVTKTAWAPATYIDNGPQFIAPVSTIEIPDGTSAKCLRGTFSAGLQIPLEEQWIVGSYYPDDFAINQRTYVFNLTVKIDDKVLYNKSMYDPDDGALWAVEMFKEADLGFEFVSDVEADTAVPFSLRIDANAQTQASGDANVYWTAQPIGLRAGRQVTLNMTGIFVRGPSAHEPISITLVNTDTPGY
jgi:hypothetical protein